MTVRIADGSAAKRILCLLLALIVLLALLSAAAYIAAEGDHDCCGEDCPVCALLSLCSGILHQPGSPAVAQAAAVLLVILSVLTDTAVGADVLRTTLFSRRVRLNI